MNLKEKKESYETLKYPKEIKLEESKPTINDIEQV